MKTVQTEKEIQDAIGALRDERNYDGKFVAMLLNSLYQKIYTLEKQVAELTK